MLSPKSGMPQAEPLLLGMARRRRRADGRTDLQCAGRLRFAAPRSSRWPLPQPGPVTAGITPALPTPTCACLRTLVAAGDAQPAVKAAKGLLKCDRQYVRGAALAVLADAARHRRRRCPTCSPPSRRAPAEYRYRRPADRSAKATTRSLRTGCRRHAAL